VTWHTEFVANSYNAAIDRIDAVEMPQAVKDAVIEAINTITVPENYLMHVKTSGNVSSFGANISAEIRYVQAVLAKPSDEVAEDGEPVTSEVTEASQGP
jgi:alpha-tubulin suppressor-like RCC1 family protein